MNKTEAKEILEGIIDSFKGAKLTNRQSDAINDAIEFCAAPPPTSEGEMAEVIWGEPLRNSYNKGFLDSKKEQIIDFIKWIGDQDLKRYSEGWCQPGGSNGFHYSDDDLYKLFCNRKNTATLPTREQGAEKEKFAIRFSEWLMIQCEYKNHCVWEYHGEEYTQQELIEIFKRTTPLPSPPKH